MFSTERYPTRRRDRRRHLVAALAVTAWATGLAFAAGGVEVTPATGPSLLTRLKAGFDGSSLGKAGYIGVPATAVETEPAAAPGGLAAGFELSGEDLYRINCRSCHGVGGKGIAADIPSLLAKIRGAAQQASGGDPTGELGVRHRLLEGGQVMPAMAHLTGDETDALLGHLEASAGVAATAPARRVTVPALRVGEHVVKAVCQICHDAVPGLPQTGTQRLQPALSEIPGRYALGDFVRRVHSTEARPAHRPRLGYLSSAELESAYFYLAAYPPR
jgi:cytochrome c5